MRFLSGDPGLPQCRTQPHSQRQDRDEDRCQRDLVAQNEFLRPVRPAFRLRQHRFALKVAADVLGEGVRTGVTFDGLRLQRLQDNRVQVAAEQRC